MRQRLDFSFIFIHLPLPFHLKRSKNIDKDLDMESEFKMTCFFEILPPEIVSEILNQLPFEDQKMARLVCRHWRELLDFNPPSRTKFAFRAELKNDSSAPPFLNSNLRFDLLAFKNLTAASGLSSVDRSLPRIDHATIEKNNSATVLQTLMTGGLNFCEFLRLRKLSLANLRGSQMMEISVNLKWDKLTHLALSVSLNRHRYDKAKNNLKNVITLFWVGKIPNLEDFVMGFNYEYEPVGSGFAGFQNLFEAFYTFIAKHAKTLRALSFRMERHRKSHPKLIPEIPNQLIEKISTDMNLKSLTLFFRGAHGFNNFVSPSILSGKNLTSIKLGSYEEPADSIGLGTTLKEIIDLNANTLKEIILYSKNVNLSWLEPCKSVESIVLNVSSVLEPDTQLSCKNLECLEFSTMEDDFPNGIVHLIEQNIRTLKRCCIFALTRGFRSPGHEPTRLQTCLNQEFPALEYFSCVTCDSWKIISNSSTRFPRLEECRLILLKMEELTLMAHWIVTDSKMINLKTLVILMQPDTVCVGILLILPKLEEIHFKRDDTTEGVPNLGAIQQFCDLTPGLTLEPSTEKLTTKGFKIRRIL